MTILYATVTIFFAQSASITDSVYVLYQSKSDDIIHVDLFKAQKNQDIFFFSPIWKSGNNMYAIHNRLLIYDCQNIIEIVNLLGNRYINIDSIEGTPKIYTIGLNVRSYFEVEHLCLTLVTQKMCKMAEPDYVILTPTSDIININPYTNPQYINQWGLNNELSPQFDVNAKSIWRYSTGRNVKIAITDVGFDLEHPDLSNNIIGSYDCTDGADGSINGNYINNKDSHGTQCAGVFGAVDNDTCIVGLSPHCKIITIRHSYHDSNDIYKAFYSWYIASIRKAYIEGADVISNSWSFSPTNSIFNSVIEEAITLGREGKGCVIVFSVGNDGNPSINHPANLEGTISVGAINSHGIKESFSNYGNELDVVAPGKDIYTTQIRNYSSYTFSTGTSMACPFVAGTAALMLSVNPDLTWLEVKNLIQSSAYKLPLYNFNVQMPNGTWNNSVGYGLVNAYTATMQAGTRTIQNKIFANNINKIIPSIILNVGSDISEEIPYGNVIITQGCKISFHASKEINITNGFEVQQGAVFEAVINDL